MSQLIGDSVAGLFVATLTKAELLALLAEHRFGLTLQHALSKDTQILLHVLV
jgi:hypothetical protein